MGFDTVVHNSAAEVGIKLLMEHCFIMDEAKWLSVHKTSWTTDIADKIASGNWINGMSTTNGY